MSSRNEHVRAQAQATDAHCRRCEVAPVAGGGGCYCSRGRSGETRQELINSYRLGSIRAWQVCPRLHIYVGFRTYCARWISSSPPRLRLLSVTESVALPPDP